MAGVTVIRTMEVEAMNFKKNLKSKIRLDGLLQRVLNTIREPPEESSVDKELTREILKTTDFKYKKIGNLEFYMRPMESEIMEILVLENELPIYHTTLGDLTLRKNPHWQDLVSIRNLRKIMNDQDVLASKGRESLKRLYENALGRLDLTYTEDDIESLVIDAQLGIEQRSVKRVRESLDLFFGLLGFEPVLFKVIRPEVHMFGRPVSEREGVPLFEHLVVFNEATLSLGLRRGAFSPINDLHLDWVIRYSDGMAEADLHGTEVLEFLAEMALSQKPLVREMFIEWRPGPSDARSTNAEAGMRG
ncbi:MAG: hypothetical protein C4576_28490 [Desulfobacteraceae bacterium]|nr:MAG: hypothetical protein C4576_28490 [Desulfobacteraceae bacterium]